MRRRFSSQWTTDPETERRWRAVLGSMTADAIRAALKRHDAVGLQAEVWIGPAPMTKGFAVDWLAWLDAYKANRTARSRTWQTFWLAVAALAAVAAALVAYFALGAPRPH
jgi:hypothetical protein